MRLSYILFVVIIAEAKKTITKKQKTAPTDDFDDYNPGIDVFQKKIQLPVPFGHINREGFEDPMMELKQPLDLLELDLKYPKNIEEQESMLRTAKPRTVQMIAKRPTVIESPRDEYFYRRDNKLPKDTYGGGLKARNDSLPRWFDLPAFQLRNMESPVKPKTKEKVVTDLEKDAIKEVLDSKPKTEYFAANSFGVLNRRTGLSRRINWTTCEEFGRGADFHPKDIVDVPWVPFFYWSKRRFAYVYLHKFTFPKKMEVKFYKNEFGKYLNITLDWTQPKLIMKSQFEMLLIAADKKGLFHAIQRMEVPDYVKQNKIQIPTQKIHLKTVGPYLAIMYCKRNAAKLMAVSGEEPPTPGRKLSEAKMLNFRGRGNPVSRNLEYEKMQERIDKEVKLAIEKNKFITIDEPIPPIFEDSYP